MKITLNNDINKAAEFVNDCSQFSSDIELTATNTETRRSIILDAKSIVGILEYLTFDKFEVDINAVGNIQEQNKFVELMRTKYAP